MARKEKDRQSKVILITGAGSGIGRAAAIKLFNVGNRIALVSRSEGRLRELSKMLDGSMYVVCDVSKSDAVEGAVRRVVGKYGRIDVLVNCAGIWIEGELEANDPEKLREAVEVNLLGQMYASKYVIPVMKNQKSGIIINIISQAGLYAKSERGPYTATKFGLVGLTKSMEPELKKYGIRVSGIYPGKTNTRLFSTAGIEKEMDNAIAPEDVAEAIEFIISRPDSVTISELGIKHIDS